MATLTTGSKPSEGRTHGQQYGFKIETGPSQCGFKGCWLFHMCFHSSSLCMLFEEESGSKPQLSPLPTSTSAQMRPLKNANGSENALHAPFEIFDAIATTYGLQALLSFLQIVLDGPPHRHRHSQQPSQLSSLPPLSVSSASASSGSTTSESSTEPPCQDSPLERPSHRSPPCLSSESGYSSSTASEDASGGTSFDGRPPPKRGKAGKPPSRSTVNDNAATIHSGCLGEAVKPATQASQPGEGAGSTVPLLQASFSSGQ